MSRNKGTPAIVTWSGDWKCGCGSQNKLWDQCVCGQPSPCREWVRGNCSMPKCRFPHPPFKIPEHLPKPADPIANPPAAAAKQKAVAQAHAAALAAERNPLCKEMAIVTWLGHWQCNCGKVHKLWDACKCGQQPPCREWVRGQCDLPKCRFPHPPFAIPSSLPKPDDPIANPTPDQLAIPLQSDQPSSKQQQQPGGKLAALAPVATANGRADSGTQGSGSSTPLAVSSATSNGSEAGGMPNPGVFGAVGQPVPAGAANGHHHKAAEPAPPPPPPPSTTKPGVSFRAALLAKSAAAAAAAAAGGGDVHAEHDVEDHLQQGADEEELAEYAEHDAAAQQHMAAAVGEEEYAAAAQQQQQQLLEGVRQGSPQNGMLDPVVAAPASARSNQAAAAATAGGLGWNPMAQGSVFSPLAPPAAAPEGPPEAGSSAAGLAAHMGGMQLESGPQAQQGVPSSQQQPPQQQQAQQQGSGSLQLPPGPAPVATHPAAAMAAGQQGMSAAAAPSPRVPPPGMLPAQQPGSAHIPPPPMSPRLGAMQQPGMAGLPGSVAAGMSPRYMGGAMQAPQAGPAMSPRFMGGGVGVARPLMGGPNQGLAQMAAVGGPGGLKPAHLAALHSNGMGLGGGGMQPGGSLGGTPHAAQQQAAQQQQQYTLQAALQQMALQQQQQQQQLSQQQKPVHVIAKTLLEFGLMDPAFYHALRQVDFLPDGYYQQDTLTLEDQQRRMELFNAAVDSYIAAGVDNRSMLEISCQAKIGLTGGPLYYRCANCAQPIPTEMRQRWCAVCKVTPFCSPECHHRLFQQHRGVCNSMLTKPLLPSQIALRIAVEIYNVHGLTGAGLHQAILRQTAAVQRSYAAAIAAAAAAGVVDE